MRPLIAALCLIVLTAVAGDAAPGRAAAGEQREAGSELGTDPVRPAGRDRDPAAPLVVVELFTSQGCSSCPPAHEIIGDLAKRNDVLALTFHVDYWDYLGWKDPFADPRFTHRQREYAHRFNLRYVYTPQIVVQGRYQTTGSDRDAVLEVADKAARAAETDSVPVFLGRDGDDLSIRLPNSLHTDPATVWLVAFDRERETPILRGENDGRTLRSHNVVRFLRPLATWHGDAVRITAMMSAFGEACAVLVQSHRDGRILGAARLDLDTAR